MSSNYLRIQIIIEASERIAFEERCGFSEHVAIRLKAMILGAI